MDSPPSSPTLIPPPPEYSSSNYGHQDQIPSQMEMQPMNTQCTNNDPSLSASNTQYRSPSSSKTHHHSGNCDCEDCCYVCCACTCWSCCSDAGGSNCDCNDAGEGAVICLVCIIVFSLFYGLFILCGVIFGCRDCCCEECECLCYKDMRINREAKLAAKNGQNMVVGPLEPSYDPSNPSQTGQTGPIQYAPSPQGSGPGPLPDGPVSEGSGYYPSNESYYNGYNPASPPSPSYHSIDIPVEVASDDSVCPPYQKTNSNPNSNNFNSNSNNPYNNTPIAGYMNPPHSNNNSNNNSLSSPPPVSPSASTSVSPPPFKYDDDEAPPSYQSHFQ